MSARTIITALLMTFALSVTAQAGIDFGLKIDDGRISSFHIAIGEHYGAKEKDVLIVRQRQIPDDELVVVFFLAKHAGVAPKAVLDMRRGGKTWWEISVHYGLNPSVYYVPVSGKAGPPYGKALGHFKNKPKKKWKSIVLSDADIVNLINLKFVSEKYGHSPDDIIRLRGQGKSFVAIHDHVKKHKAAKKRQMAAAERVKKKQQAKSRGKGKH